MPAEEHITQPWDSYVTKFWSMRLKLTLLDGPSGKAL